MVVGSSDGTGSSSGAAVVIGGSTALSVLDGMTDGSSTGGTLDVDVLV